MFKGELSLSLQCPSGQTSYSSEQCWQPEKVRAWGKEEKQEQKIKKGRKGYVENHTSSTALSSTEIQNGHTSHSKFSSSHIKKVKQMKVILVLYSTLYKIHY